MGVLLYIGGLLLAGLVGWVISILMSLPGRSAREHKQTELIKAAAKEGAQEGVKEVLEWQRKHPNEPITPAAKDVIVNVASLTAAATIMEPVFDAVGVTDKVKVQMNPPGSGGAAQGGEGPQ
jgi:hypothetical protein